MPTKINKFNFIIIILIFNLACSIQAQQDPLNKEKTVGHVTDTSKTLNKKKQILPVIIPVTEPAVGYGAIGGILYMIPKREPDIIVALAGLTSNGSWFTGGGYVGFWNDGNLRYRGLAGYGKLTLDYYAFNGKLPITFDQKIFSLIQQISFRLGNSDYFLGGKYQFSKINIPLHSDPDFESIIPEDIDLINSGITGILEFDNLNNFLSPTKGSKVTISYLQNLELLGSTRDWGSLNFTSYTFLPVNKIWTPGLRIESHLSTGRPPFYSKPYVSLRGVPAMRYQGNFTALAETEQLFNFKPRWGLVAFTGIGAAFESIEELKIDELVWNAGVGVRFLAIRSMGTKVGFDIARGPEDWAFYVNIGYSWLR
ncbi:MAG: hypothetical protein ABFR32_02575 [Bacteroidota bacterium]